MIRVSHARRSARSVPASSRRRDERGVILPLVLISVTAFILLSVLVIDGSHAYPQRRDMQNAADAAAVAGTRTLDNVKYEGAPWATVPATVARSVNANGADSHECLVVASNAAVLGRCDQAAAVLHAQAAGVKVRSTVGRPTTFGAFVGKDEVTATAEATATIQRFIGDTGVPFIVCGNAALGGYDLLTDGKIDPVKAAALGRVPIQEAQVPGCGAGSAFKGKIAEGAIIPQVPGWIDGAQGTGFNSIIQVQVLGATACTEADIAILEGGQGDVDCDLLIPIADHGTGNGNNIQMHAVDWGIFNVTGDGHGNPKYWGEYRASAAHLANGRTSTQLPGHGGEPRVIRLIE